MLEQTVKIFRVLGGIGDDPQFAFRVLARLSNADPALRVSQLKALSDVFASVHTALQAGSPAPAAAAPSAGGQLAPGPASSSLLLGAQRVPIRGRSRRGLMSGVRIAGDCA